MTKQNIVKVLGWLLVFIVSVYALLQSNKSINIANQALIIGQRPHLFVEPVKFNETGKYFFAEEVDQGISIKARLEITNTGNSTAKNITTSDIFISSVESIRPDLALKNEIKCDKPGSPTLVPNGSAQVEIGGIIPTNTKESVRNMLDQIEKNEFSLPFNIEFYYDYEINSRKGKTILSLVLWPEKVVINYSLEE